MNTNALFSIESEDDFVIKSLNVFRFQAEHNLVYRKYLKLLNVKAEEITNLNQIPFIPVEFFKSHTILTSTTENDTPCKHVFESSGTTGSTPSKHYVNDISIYEKSYLSGFNHFYGAIEDYCVIALLPSYIERGTSSLTYMANDMINKSSHPKSGFYLYNYEELINTLEELSNLKQKTLLLGVSFALLDLADEYAKLKSKTIDFSTITVMETGGMKGKRKEMIREELHAYLNERFLTKTIHSEYGMTELLSQAYSKAKGIYQTPPWMKILIRDVNDPFSYLPVNKTGGVNIIDLANVNSCSFIATQDLGKIDIHNNFEIVGRFDVSDIRGCNLMVI